MDGLKKKWRSMYLMEQIFAIAGIVVAAVCLVMGAPLYAVVFLLLILLMMMSLSASRTKRLSRKYGTLYFHTEDWMDEHREEMAQIAQQIIMQTVPPLVEEICAKQWNEAAERLIGAIEWDIQEIISVSFDDMGEIFHSEKFRKVISSKIMESIKKNIKGITIK